MATLSWKAALLRNHARLLRLAVWMIAMVAATLVVVSYWPRRAAFVPLFFLMIMRTAVMQPVPFSKASPPA